MGFHRRRRGGESAALDVGCIPGAAARADHRRYPLCHQMVEVRQHMVGVFARYDSRRCQAAGTVCAGLLRWRLCQLWGSMERTALPGQVVWQLGRVIELIDETPRTKSLLLDVPGWAGHRAGQHVDIRLTAEDGYQAERSYSIASPPEARQVTL